MKKTPDMNEMIEQCRRKQRPDEEICFAVGAGRLAIFPTDPKEMKKAMNKALDYIKELEGFCGLHPVDIWHTLIVFDTLNHAKIGMNLMKAKGIPLGQIAPILVEKRYIGGQNA